MSASSFYEVLILDIYTFQQYRDIQPHLASEDSRNAASDRNGSRAGAILARAELRIIRDAYKRGDYSAALREWLPLNLCTEVLIY